MKSEIGIALRMTVATLALTGLAYPLLVTGLAQLAFPRQANGSLVVQGDRVVGSELIGQPFKGAAWFHPRPSAAGADGYDGAASSGSNLGPTSLKLRDRIAAEARRLQEENPQAEGPVPLEMVTASGSGLDPHVSPAAAMWQAPRVAAARGVAVEEIRSLVEGRVEGRSLGILGEPRVNVLLLNLDLDRRFGAPPAAAVMPRPGMPVRDPA
jgi:K+-transporting ATPase ATPase C chain